jgi:hypothetical protein
MKHTYTRVLIWMLGLLLCSACAGPAADVQDVAVVEQVDETPVDAEQQEIDLAEVEGWALLAEKDAYDDVGMTNLPIDYIDIERMKTTLLNAGWEADQILEVREFDRDSLRDGLAWLAENADEDDIALTLISGHGNYVREVIGWADFAAEDWVVIPAERRVLIMATCQAQNYTAALSEADSTITVAGAAGHEYGWSGLEEEGLPIIGSVFGYYLTEAFSEAAADSDGDGYVSVQEAAAYAEPQQQAYMHDVVFAVPEYAAMYHQLGVQPENNPEYPHIVVDDRYGEPLNLDLNAY